MGDQPLRKTNLGNRFSEGARRLWLLLESRGWSQSDLAADIDKHRARRAATRRAQTPAKSSPYTGVVSRWLYGERAPDRDSSLFLQGQYGIDAALWAKPPEEPFVPPAARAAARDAA